ncbi:MAG: BatA domain-containing protein [Candidatus Zixiibacteriota bacterium]
MLAFLNKIFLPFFLLVALPIIIHLLTRKKRERIKFPTIRFLQKIQERRMRKFRIRQIILLILRTLIVFFLVGSFARPTIRTRNAQAVGEHQPTSVAFVIDRSYSMSSNADGVAVMTRAKDAARQISDMLKAGDMATIIPFDEKPYKAFEKPTKLLEDVPAVIETLSWGYHKTDVFSAVELALDEIEPTVAVSKEIYLLTDKAGGGFERPGKIDIPERVRLYIFPFERSSDINVGISEVEFPSNLIEVGKPIELSAKVENFSDIGIGQQPVSLYINGERRAQSGIELPQNAARSIELTAGVDKGGIHEGFFETPGDLVSVDNKRYFTFRIPEQLNVLIVGSDVETQFIELALKSGSETYFNTRKRSYRATANEYLRETDIVILDRMRPISQAFKSRLQRFVQEGGGLMVLGIHSDASSEKSTSDFLNSLAGINPGTLLGDKGSESYVTPGKADFSHPVFSVFENDGLPPVKFYNFFQADARADRIMSFSNGTGAVFDAEYVDGRIIFTSFILDYQGSDILTGGFFVPFIQRSTQYLAGEMAKFDRSYLIGDQIIRSIEDFPVDANLIIENPNGIKLYKTPKFNVGKALYSLESTELPGIYHVYADDELVDAFAVNIDTEESRQNVSDRELIESKFKGAEPIWIDPNSENINQQILQARYGRELRRLFLWIALALMVLELIIETMWKKPKDEKVHTDF